MCNVHARTYNKNINGILKWMVKAKSKEELAFTIYCGINTSKKIVFYDKKINIKQAVLGGKLNESSNKELVIEKIKSFKYGEGMKIFYTKK